MAATKDAKELPWLLETGRDVEYHVPRNDEKYNAMCESYNRGTLEQDFPLEVKRLQGKIDPTPERLHNATHYAKDSEGHVKDNVVKYRSDSDGTIEIDNEADAIYLYKKCKALNEATCFNEKYGRPMPVALKKELEAEAKRLLEEQIRAARLAGIPIPTVI